MRKLVCAVVAACGACGGSGGGDQADATSAVDALPCTGNEWQVMKKAGVDTLAGITGGQLRLRAGLQGNASTLMVRQLNFTGDFVIRASFVDLSLFPEQSYVEMWVVDGVTRDRYWIAGVYRYMGELNAEVYQSPPGAVGFRPTSFEETDGVLIMRRYGGNVNLYSSISSASVEVDAPFDATRFDVYLVLGSNLPTAAATDTVEIAFTQVDMTIDGTDHSDTFDCDTLGQVTTF